MQLAYITSCAFFWGGEAFIAALQLTQPIGITDLSGMYKPIS